MKLKCADGHEFEILNWAKEPPKRCPFVVHSKGCTGKVIVPAKKVAK